MKKVLVSLLVLAGFSSYAQDYKPWKLTVAGGYARPWNKGGKSGFVYSAEPQYGVSNFFDIGLRLEQAFINRPEVLNGLAYDSEAKSALSGMATLNYNIRLATTVKLYAGTGVGLYRFGSSQKTINGQPYTLKTATRTGLLLRTGLKIEQWSAELAYNFIPSVTDKSTTTGDKLVGKNSYFTIKVGYTFGGGLKE
ncbi:metallophosphoesterase family protein [Siphonobacter aquaeclarae]|jgi:opacity protein-like surface antigen|nr:outer membrane beta-barrel protein [Siphonobacter aquaeclarae]MBO9640214.1 outer membrane beta-barrel protein [Siphonobacter aquaeclarae]